MTVSIHVTLEPGDSLVDKLRNVGLLPQLGDLVPTLREHLPSPQPDTFVSVPMDVAVEPPKRRPGRPRKSDAPPAPTAADSDGEPVNPVVYLVRRYGGDADSEHGNPAKAVERLLDLAKEAMDPEALEALSAANEGLVEGLTPTMAEEVQDAFANLFASLDQPAAAPTPEPAPVPAAKPPGIGPEWPFGQNQQPLKAITADAQGARDAIMAIVAGPAPKFGLDVAQKILAGKGIPKLSALPDGSPIFAEVAREGAALLGLPVAATTAADLT